MISTYILNDATPRAAVATSRIFLYSSLTGEAHSTICSSTSLQHKFLLSSTAHSSPAQFYAC